MGKRKGVELLLTLWWEGRWGSGEGVKRFFGRGGGSLVLITSRKRGKGVGPYKFSHLTKIFELWPIRIL